MSEKVIVFRRLAIPHFLRGGRGAVSQCSTGDGIADGAHLLAPVTVAALEDNHAGRLVIGGP